MKPTTEQIIDWGRTALNETGALIPTEWNMKLLEAICSAAYEAGVADEREACAKVCEDLPADELITRTEATVWDIATLDCAAAIRKRGAP